MCNINKYLETQFTLAAQRKLRKSEISANISKRSELVAKLISKEEEDKVISTKNNRKIKKGHDNTLGNLTPTEFSTSHTGINTEINNLSKSSQKNSLKKIIDDGDRVSFNKRIREWKKKLLAAQRGRTINGIISADIQYILNGNKNVEEKHLVNSGLCVPKYIWKQLYKYQKAGVKWLWKLHRSESGGLLGDEMGLGKTVQIIAFLAGLSTTESGSGQEFGPSLIIVPATLIFQWVSHFHYWFPRLRTAVLHKSGSFVGNPKQLIHEVWKSCGVLLVTYSGVVIYSKILSSQKWQYVILDEGHKIKNPNTQVNKHIKKFLTPHRILITGSPMQNSLQELWSIIDFIRPGLLGTYDVFMEYFAQPIIQGGYTNANRLQQTIALEMAKSIKYIITPYMLRRSKSEVQKYVKLPEKTEQVLFCSLSEEQKDLYRGYLMSNTVRYILKKYHRFDERLRARVLVALSTLRKICNHPHLYLNGILGSNSLDKNSWKRCGKMVVVDTLLKMWQKQGHRTVIFSQSRAMLHLFELYLQNEDLRYLKIDGGVNISQRQNLFQTFNENSEYLVFLSTTRVGGLGVNLTGADRVIIYDPDWNPATDNQAKERAWRIGQKRNVIVYRLVSEGTIEAKIYQRQLFKNLLSNKILIDSIQKNMFTTSSLQGLFSMEYMNCYDKSKTMVLFEPVEIVNEKNIGFSCSNVSQSLQRQVLGYHHQSQCVIGGNNSSLDISKFKNSMTDKYIEGNIGDNDDYVLNKLFARASITSALHHDAVFKASEKEKMFRMKKEA